MAKRSGPSEKRDEIVVTLGDSTLRASDVALLSPGKWLNDAVIAFAFEWLTLKKLAKNTIKLLCPASVQLGRTLSTDVQFITDTFGEQLGLSRSTLALLPVNNTRSEQLGTWGTGTHWSLLAVVAAHEANHISFIHIDSLGTANQHCAREVMDAFIPAFPQTTNMDFRSCATSPRQQNGSDCGVFVIAFAAALTTEFEHNPHPTPSEVDAAIARLSVEAISGSMRKTILSWIHQSQL